MMRPKQLSPVCQNAQSARIVSFWLQTGTGIGILEGPGEFVTNRKACILVVEDEAVSRMKLVAYLQREGFAVKEAATSSEAKKALSEYVVDLVLLDINLPDGDGLQIAGELRAKSEIGIILVTSKTDEIDRIVGIEVGADDYVTKPYNPRELLARIRALLRRSGLAKEDTREIHIYQFGPWELDLQRRSLAAADGDVIKLTRGEYEMLHVFLAHAGTVLSRDFLMSHINHRSWSPNDRSIDVLVARLRRLLEENPKDPRYIVTAHGEGYIFVEDIVAK